MTDVRVFFETSTSTARAASSPLPQTNQALDVEHTYEVNTIFKIGEEIFCYYPTSLLVAADDIQSELIKVILKQDHTLILSGYPILEFIFCNEVIDVYDVNPSFGGKRGEYVGQINADSFEIELREALKVISSNLIEQ